MQDNMKNLQTFPLCSFSSHSFLFLYFSFSLFFFFSFSSSLSFSYSFFYLLFPFLFSSPIFIFISFFSLRNLVTLYVRLKRQKISWSTHRFFPSINFLSSQRGPKQAWNMSAWWCLTLPAVYAVTVSARSRVVSLALCTSLSTLKNV